jgi:hypothetical protein
MRDRKIVGELSKFCQPGYASKPQPMFTFTEGIRVSPRQRAFEESR